MIAAADANPVVWCARALSDSSTAANSYALRKRFPTHVSQDRTPRVVKSETWVTGYGPTYLPSEPPSDRGREQLMEVRIHS
jgi:hypothetical protein